MHKCLFVIILQIATIYMQSCEDQKPFYDILILKNPVSSNNRRIITTNIDGELVINKAKIDKNR